MAESMLICEPLSCCSG